jgi:hypothetical protein
MPFEQILRDHLLDDAEVVALPDRGDPGRAITRARARRRHRLTGVAVAAVAAVGAAGVAAFPALKDDGGGTVVSPAAQELEPTGPLDLAWNATEDGLSGVQSQFQVADGSVYALATGPGVRYGNDLPFPMALYRLDENGVWQQQPLDDGHRMQDVAGVDTTLYGVSTGPAAQGDGSVVRLSRSDDGGQTWTDEDIPPADPPSVSGDWHGYTTMKVESNGPVTLAMVTTQFGPDLAALFPEMADTAGGYFADPRDEGLVLVKAGTQGRLRTEDGVVWQAPAPTTTVTAALTPTATETIPAPADPEAGDPTGTPDQDVRTIPWSELGVSSKDEAYTVKNQVFRLSGDSWEAVDNDLGDALVVSFGLAGDLFTASSVQMDPNTAASDGVLYVSADGASWTKVEVPDQGFVVGAGPGLVNTSYESTTVNVSADGGTTWTETDLAAVGAPPGGHVVESAGGPLGVALVMTDAAGNPQSLATSADLVTWTVTPLAEIAGTDDIAVVSPFVGRDRIVVRIMGHHPVPGSDEPGPSRTVVGTPRRS